MIRAAVLADVPRMVRHRYPGEAGDHLNGYADWLCDALPDGRYHGWLAERSGQVIGGVGLVRLEWGPTRQDPSPFRGRVVNMYVEVEARRQGVARALLATVIQAAPTLGLSTLSVGTTVLARPLYRELGFAGVATEMLLRLPG
ncbi:GNAT family N-acetyltransferase [Deinococcus sonorensis]|uniref:GNAT family N-acetyltransferase n=2 Tax=Deinococcus sonorensis TaxID=309891 RepID=A0AAU7U8I6_9DEIO